MRGARGPSVLPGDVAVIGAGTLGLLTIAALRHLGADRTIVATAKHPQQQRRRASSAPTCGGLGELAAGRAVAHGLDGDRRAAHRRRRPPWSMRRERGVDRASAAVVAPGGEVALVGMPGPTTQLD